MIQDAQQKSDFKVDAILSTRELVEKYGDQLGVAAKDPNRGCHPEFTLMKWVESESQVPYWDWVKVQAAGH